MKFKYGSGNISFEIPQNAKILNIKEPTSNISKEEFCNRLLSLIPDKSYSNVGVVVADKTRLCDYPKYLPWLLETLSKKGIKKEYLKFYIAYGTHPFQSEEESLNSYGEIYNQYQFIHHDSAATSVFTDLGITQRETPVMVREDAIKSDLLITFGAISHHYFAGFGGGRKLLFPGLGEKKAIYHNHSLYINNQKKMLEPGCLPGKLDGNPLAEDLKEIDELLPERISIHGILNSTGSICQFMFGKSYNDFLKACELHNSFYKINSEKIYDIVVASSGGYPKDINFIQSHKSVHNAAAFVKDGGTLIILAECREGIGTNTFLPLFEENSWKKMLTKLAKNYTGNGGTALAMKSKTNRIKIFIITSLPEKSCRLMGMHKIEPSDASHLIQANNGSIAVILNASMLIK